jgi:hypothetical protein
MNGLKLWAMALVAGGVFVCSSAAEAQVIVAGYAPAPIVAGTVYTPVPMGVAYSTYSPVVPVTYTYGVPAVASTIVAPTYVAPAAYVGPVYGPIVPAYGRVVVRPYRGVVRVRF